MIRLLSVGVTIKRMVTGMLKMGDADGSVFNSIFLGEQV